VQIEFLIGVSKFVIVHRPAGLLVTHQKLRCLNMDDLEKEKLAVKAYRLSEMTDLDWKKVMPKYRHQLREWWLLPNILWFFIIIVDWGRPTVNAWQLRMNAKTSQVFWV